MRILMISTPYSAHTKAWIDGLEECGIDVIVLFVKDWISQTSRISGDLGVETILLKSPSKWQMISEIIKRRSIKPIFRDLRNRTKLHQELMILGPQIREIALEKQIDLIHAHGMTNSALLAAASGFHPFSASAWGSDIYVATSKYPYLHRLLKDAISDAAFIQVESEMSANRIKEISPIDDERLMISPWGVNVADYEQVPETGTIPHPITGLNKKVILSFRALEPIYQQHFIIRAFSKIIPEYDHVVLIIGSDGSERESLANLVQQLGISDRVIFTGFVDSNIKRALFANAYCYIQCPVSDGVAITVMEAMASGLPIITSNAGENKVIVKEGIHGYLVDPPYVDNLANAMKRLLDDEELRNRMGSNVRSFAINNLSRSKFFELFQKKAIGSLGE